MEHQNYLRGSLTKKKTITTTKSAIHFISHLFKFHSRLVSRFLVAGNLEFSPNHCLGLRFLCRGCLHEKTRTGVSFIPGWLFYFVSLLQHDRVYLKVYFMLIKYTLRLKITNIIHALPVPVYRQTDLMIPLRDFVPEWNSRPGETTGWTHAGVTRAGMTFCGGII